MHLLLYYVIKRQVNKCLFRPTRSALITAGIGDFFVLDSAFNDEFRSSLKNLCYATRAAKDIKSLIEKNPAYKVQNHYILSEDQRAITRISQVKQMLIEDGRFEEFKLLSECMDLSIFYSFSKCERYLNSSFLMYQMSKISITLPDKFYILCPYSYNYMDQRDFDTEDWSFFLDFLAPKFNFVAIGGGSYQIPEHPNIINMFNKTSIFEAIEILKQASGYVGIGSSFSVLAAKLFSSSNLMIRQKNENWMTKVKKIYFSPHRSFEFLGKSLEEIYNTNGFT